MRYGRHLVAATLGTSLMFSGVAMGVASIAPSAHAQEIGAGTAAVVDVDFLNVRQTPSLSGAIVTTLARGDEVDVTTGPVAADGYDWYRLQQDGAFIGWSVAGFLGATDGDVTTPVVGWAYGDSVVVDTDVLNVRATPALTGQVLDVYESGTTATITGDATSADGVVWYPVDNLGWVAGQYLAGSDGSGSGNDGSDGSAPAGNWVYGDSVVTTDVLNVRQSPSTSAAVLDVYESGTRATVTGDATTADGVVWYPIDNLGWVAGQYLGDADGASGNDPGNGGSGSDPEDGGSSGTFGYGDVVVVDTDLLNVRSLPTSTGSILDVYPSGTQATITGDATDADGITWYPVDNTGWVAGQYLALASAAPEQPAASATASESATASGSATGSGSASASASAVPSGSSAAPSSSAAPRSSTAPSIAASPSTSARPSAVASTSGSAAPSASASASSSAAASGSATASAAPSAGANVEVFKDGDRVAVAATRLNVRAEASPSGAILRAVGSGTEFTINGGPVEVDGVTWYNVGTGTDEEWVVGEFLSAVVSAT